jgi:hypothetical protein
MKFNCSRRKGLQILVGLPFFHSISGEGSTGQQVQQAEAVVLFSKVNQASRAFVHKASGFLDCVLLELDLQQPASFASISKLPENTLIIGLVSEAEKIIVESVVQNRRGYLQTTGYLHLEDSFESSIDNLVTASIQQGLGVGGSSQRATSESGTLSSFYAYI